MDGILGVIMSDEDRAQLILRLQVICGALMWSVLIYVGLAWFLGRQGAAGNMTKALPAALPGALLVAAALLLLASNRVPRMMLARAAEPDEAGGAIVPIQAVQSAYVVGFALRETVAIFGLVLTLTSGDMIWVLALSAVAILAMVAGWPTRSRVEAHLDVGSGPLEP